MNFDPSGVDIIHAQDPVFGMKQDDPSLKAYPLPFSICASRWLVVVEADK